MFITRKEFERIIENIIAHQLEEKKSILEKVEKKEYQLLALAKELGYTWESEAVKEIKKPYMTVTSSDGRYQEYGGEEKAVIKWGWKKINKK